MNVRPLALAMLAAASCAGCRGNQYTFALPAPGQPPQVAVQSTTLKIVVSWAAVEEAAGYVIFVNTAREAAASLATTECFGTDDPLSPCLLDAVYQPGQVQYVRVAALVDGFDPTDYEAVDDLPSLAVRPAYSGEDPGPRVWAGTSHVTEGGVYLQGAWFEDPIGSPHSCRVFWGDTPEGGAGLEQECASQDLSVSSGAYLEALAHFYERSGTFYPLLDIGSDDGRFGQALTTVTRL